MSKAKSILVQHLVTDPKILSERVDETDVPNEWIKLHQAIKNVKEYLYTHKDIFALTAPQLGYNYRFFCIKFSRGDDIRVFIDPIIIKSKGLHISREKCSSLGDKEYFIPRYDEVVATYITSTGHVETNQFNGVVGEVFQQMFHMLDGILLTDFGEEVIPEFDLASKEDQDKVIQMYVESLQKRLKSLKDIIKNNETLKRIDEAIDFMTNVQTGKVKLEQGDFIKTTKDGKKEVLSKEEVKEYVKKYQQEVVKKAKEHMKEVEDAEKKEKEDVNN